MAAFPKMTLTNVGQALQTKVLAGAELTFTRIALGDGKLNGQPISPLTALIHQTASVPVDTVVVINDDTCQASGFFSNTDISTGFWWRETGIFAQDPDVGEILYGYTNAGDAGDYIPPVQDTRIEKYIFCSIAVANAETVNITIPSSDTFIPLTQKGAPGGVATLDSTGKVPKEQLPEMDAASVAYDNGSSGLVASTVQGALDELVMGLNEGTIAQADATLTSTGWTGDTPTQTLSVPGLPANSPAWIGLAVTATAVQRDAARKAALSPTSRAAGSVTITADGAQPTTDLPVTVYYVKKAPEGGAVMLASIINMFPGGSTLQIPLDAPTSFASEAGNAEVSLTWTDPNDKYATPEGETAQDPDQLVSAWSHTVLVRKTGSQPAGPNDGTVVISSSVRNQYQSTPYVDTGLTNDTVYYYGVFAYNEDGVASPGAFTNATPVAGTALSQLPPGTGIQILENGAPVQFRIGTHNYEPGLNGNGRTLVVRMVRDAPRVYTEEGEPEFFPSSSIASYLNTTCLNRYSEKVKSWIGSTKYLARYSPEKLSPQGGDTALFLPSIDECGYHESGDVVDGTAFPAAAQIFNTSTIPARTCIWTRSADNTFDSTVVLANILDYNYLRASTAFTSKNYSNKYTMYCFTLPSGCRVDADLTLMENVDPE